jgi:hypothetical protein
MGEERRAKPRRPSGRLANILRATGDGRRASGGSRQATPLLLLWRLWARIAQPRTLASLPGSVPLAPTRRSSCPPRGPATHRIGPGSATAPGRSREEGKRRRAKGETSSGPIAIESDWRCFALRSSIPVARRPLPASRNEQDPRLASPRLSVVSLLASGRRSVQCATRRGLIACRRCIALRIAHRALPIPNCQLPIAG